MFQQYLLFPHMSVLENVAFGLRARGVDKSAAHEEARHWLRRVGSAGIERSRPDQLSGGQAQRVALARALASEPKLLLLDEPLAALDAATRVEVRRELRRHLSEFRGCAVLVTHDPVDAYTLADRVVIIENGHVVQDGTFTEIAAHPRSAYVAELVGVNLLTGSVMGGVFRGRRRGDPRRRGRRRRRPGDRGDPPTGRVAARVEAGRQPAERVARDRWSMSTIVPIACVCVSKVPIQLTAEITFGAAEALRVKVGRELWAAVKATEITVTLN